MPLKLESHTCWPGRQSSRFFYAQATIACLKSKKGGRPTAGRVLPGPACESAAAASSQGVAEPVPTISLLCAGVVLSGRRPFGLGAAVSYAVGPTSPLAPRPAQTLTAILHNHVPSRADAAAPAPLPVSPSSQTQLPPHSRSVWRVPALGPRSKLSLCQAVQHFKNS
jgi:hypothetical protein